MRLKNMLLINLLGLCSGWLLPSCNDVATGSVVDEPIFYYDSISATIMSDSLYAPMIIEEYAPRLIYPMLPLSNLDGPVWEQQDIKAE